MIINQPGYELEYEGKTYRIGDQVVGTGESEYEGLFGVVTEIRTGDDKETENETLDIYCSFDEPVLPYDIEKLEKRFSRLYDEPKSLDDITLDMVIMAPEMIEVIEADSEDHQTVTVYTVEEDWAVECDHGKSVATFTDQVTAELDFHRKLSEEIQDGSITEWKDDKEFRVESGESYYEGWLCGRYCENHYSISLSKNDITLSAPVFGRIGRAYIDERSGEDFKIHLDHVTRLKCISEKQYEEMLSQTDIPELIRKKLGMNDRFWEAYWDTIADVVNQAVEKAL